MASSLLHRALVSPLILEKKAVKPLAFAVSVGVTVIPPILIFNTTTLPVWLSIAIFMLDGAMLWLLPITKRSWGPFMPPFFALTLLRGFILLMFSLILGAGEWLIYVNYLIQLLISLVAIYGLYFESVMIKVTRQSFQHPALNGLPQPLTLLHLGDLHFEHRGKREERLLDAIKSLNPDLIVFTGDFINLSYSEDPAVWEELREYVGCWKADSGIYFVSGTPLVESEEALTGITEDLPFRWLRGTWEYVPQTGGTVAIAGFACTHDIEVDGVNAKALAEQIPEGPFKLLLFHSPDIAEMIAKSGFSLMLSGHTHGGQIRLPLVGPLVTSSALGRKYVSGLHQIEDMMLYVSRGIGLEGASAPRARLLCPPEIILWTLEGKDDSSPPRSEEG